MATKIVLIDDDLSVRRGLSRLLRTHGFECVVYASGEAAFEDAELTRARFLIVDIQLSGMDGFAIRDRLRADGLKIPMMFITAFIDADSPDWRRRMGATPYLAKPFEAADLFAIIERTLGPNHRYQPSDADTVNDHS
jgi:FixJ family two-component response regulator